MELTRIMVSGKELW